MPRCKELCVSYLLRYELHLSSLVSYMNVLRGPANCVLRADVSFLIHSFCNILKAWAVQKNVSSRDFTNITLGVVRCLSSDVRVFPRFGSTSVFR
jgi:hypothetical protein